MIVELRRWHRALERESTPSKVAAVQACTGQLIRRSNADVVGNVNWQNYEAFGLVVAVFCGLVLCVELLASVFTTLAH